LRRIKLVLGALALVVAMFAAFAGPAMADNLNNCRDAQGSLIRCDGQFFAPVSDFNNDGLFLTGNDFFPFFGFPGFGAFDNINGINTFDNVNGFDGFHNGFDGNHNGVFQSVR
jgi:hypothetical protein